MIEKEYKIDYAKPEEAAVTTLNMFKDTLVACRGKSPKPEELEWEIRLYDFMLLDPVARLEAYMKTRVPKLGKAPLAKRKVVEMLGWEVP